MFKLYAEKNSLTVNAREAVTSGSVNVYRAEFSFGKGWEDLVKTAIFKAGEQTAAVLLGEDGRCVIPWEVLTEPSITLKAGVYGTRDGVVVLPTAWASLGVILSGTTPGRAAGPPTPGIYEQILAELGNRGNRLEYDGEDLSLFADDKKLSSVPVTGGGAEDGSGMTEISGDEVQNIWNS